MAWANGQAGVPQSYSFNEAPAKSGGESGYRYAKNRASGRLTLQ